MSLQTHRPPERTHARLFALLEQGRAKVTRTKMADDGSTTVTLVIEPPEQYRKCGALLGSITHGGPNQHCRLGYGHFVPCRPDVVRHNDGTIGPPVDAEEAGS